jgi:hypothetical protein
MSEETEGGNLPASKWSLQDAPSPANVVRSGDTGRTSQRPGGGDPWIRVICALLLVGIVVIGVLWYTDNSSLSNRINGLSSQVTSTNSALVNTQVELDAARQEALHPTLGTWNISSSIGPNAWREASVPDTFTFRLRFTADSDIFFAFLTLSEYVRFNQCPNSVYANDRSINRLAAGCVDYWIFNNKPPGDRVGVYAAGVNASFDFHQAEGCASWVMVLMPEKAGVTVTISPQVAVTYNPASKPTPPCG